MECNEKFLRQMFESPYGHNVGQAILERLEHGLTVTILESDGSRIQLGDHENAIKLLVERFGWKPD
jgi:hypothetical protein